MKLGKISVAALLFIAVPTVVADWIVSYDNDEMRGTSTKFLQTDSDNTVNFDFPYNGGSSMTLVLRSKKTELKDGQKADDLKPAEAMLMISKGQFSCASIDGCSISVKFDSEKIQKYEVNTAANGRSDVLFIGNAPSFIKNIQTHKKLMLEANFYQAGPRQFKFNLEGYSTPKNN